MSDFVHLHVHSEYSLLDGACRIRDAVKKAKEMGQDALAITDHGVMYGSVEFYKACKNIGIKPIIGCEVYVSPASRFEKSMKGDKYSHLVLLCKNEIGYKNLIKLVSLGFTEGFYAKPRIDMELLEKYHEGLVALSGCISGDVPKRIIEGDIEMAKQHASKMKGLFGDDYYFEMQRHGINEENTVNDVLITLSRELSIPLVATNDAHYVEKDDAETQAVLMCIQTGTTLSEGRAYGFDKNEFYLKSSEEMKKLFFDQPSAIENTVRIAEKCDFSFDFDKLFLPAFYPPDFLSSKDYLRQLCEEGLKRRLEKTQGFDEKAYRDRLDYELSVVNKMGYDEYYLIVNDFISYAKGEGIPVGPGRGSGAGSLAAYCLGITDVDPIKHDLLFERFLNPERVSMPDFDVDFCYYRRQEVIDYVARKYGKDHVAQIVTFGTLAAKAAIRDVGRVLGMSYSDVDVVAKLIPQSLGITIERALEESAELRQLVRDDFNVNSLIKIAKKIEGMPRNTSTHAAGVVITDMAVMDYVPLSMNGDAIVTQYTMNDIADLGLLKIDFLGLRYLTVIYEAAKNAGIRVSDIPLDDSKTYDILSSGDTDGVFQLESGGMRSLLMRMNARSIEDITIAISLYRPGPMDSIPKFLANRKNPSGVKYLHESLEDILSVTNGCIVYQEQVMQIFRKLAGYSFGRADIVRRAMSKKKQSVMDEERRYFIYGKKDENGNTEVVGAVNNGVPEDVANAIYDDMATFAQYAFNKSHAACYAYLAYYSAYLKCNYPAQYLASLISSVIGSTEKVMEYITSCKKNGINVRRPSVNESGISFGVNEKNEIVFGLMAIKNVGESFVRNIVKKRMDGPFLSLEDFLSRLSDGEINKRMVESLIRAGAMDDLGKKRSQLLAVYSDAIDAIQRRNNRNVEGQFDMFSMANMGEDKGAINVNYPDIAEFTTAEKLNMEREMTGLYLSGHPLEKYQDTANKLRCDKLSSINAAVFDGDRSVYRDGKSVTLLGIVTGKKEKLTKKDERMAFASFEDETGETELILFPKVYEVSARKLRDSVPICVTGELSVKEARGEDSERKEEAKVLVRSVYDISAGELPSVKSQGTYKKEEPKKTSAFPSDAKTVKVNLSAFMMGQNAQTPVSAPISAHKTAEKENGQKDLYLKIPSENAKEFSRALSVVDIYSYGKTEVYIYFADSKKLVRLSGRKVNLTDTLIKALENILGSENVKLKDKK